MRALADDFGAPLIPFQAAFDQAVTDHPEDYWGADSVHPTAAGRDLMAA